MIRTRELAEIQGSRFDAPEDVQGKTETALMVLFRERRGSAEFQTLYDYTRAGLLGWIASQVRSRRLQKDPAELLQDTFVNIFRYCGGFRDERAESFRVWSRRIATNVVRRAALRQPGPYSLLALDESLQEPADRRSEPSARVSGAEEVRALRIAWMILLAHYAAALEVLRERERTALELIEIEGCSYLDAATRLGVGRSNMKMIVFRARKRVRAEIVRRMETSVVSRRSLAV